MKTDCPHRCHAIDFITGELDPATAGVFSRHLGECETCRAEVDSAHRLIASLRSLPEPEYRDRTEEILAAVKRGENRPATPVWKRPLAAAAAIAILATAFWAPKRPANSPIASVSTDTPKAGSTPDASIRKAVDWLKANQSADGSWDAKKWGGRPQFQVALTALPAIAIQHAGEPADQSARMAVRWLLGQQSADGLIGPKGVGLPFNHSLATFALLQAANGRSESELKAPLKAALDAILRNQTRDGGWGHYGSPFSNNSITAWHLRTLETAAASGWTEVMPALERAKASLASQVQDTRGTPAASGDGAIPDMCATYFSAGELSRQNDPAAREKLSSIRETLLALQENAGNDSGSWPPDGTWGHAGGRLYSTALASLTLDAR